MSSDAEISTQELQKRFVEVFSQLDIKVRGAEYYLLQTQINEREEEIETAFYEIIQLQQQLETAYQAVVKPSGDTV